MTFQSLWFTFKVVPLVYEIQHTIVGLLTGKGCDLLSKSYLWYMRYNFWIELWMLSPLWFAFKVVPLVYEIQLFGRKKEEKISCDLLSKSYLWYMRYNNFLDDEFGPVVVICFQSRTFGIWDTTGGVWKFIRL